MYKKSAVTWPTLHPTAMAHAITSGTTPNSRGNTRSTSPTLNPTSQAHAVTLGTTLNSRGNDRSTSPTLKLTAMAHAVILGTTLNSRGSHLIPTRTTVQQQMEEHQISTGTRKTTKHPKHSHKYKKACTTNKHNAYKQKHEKHKKYGNFFFFGGGHVEGHME